MPQRVNYQCLVPPHVTDIYVSSLAEVLEYKSLLPHWLEYWAKAQASAEQRIAQLKELYDFMNGQTPESIRTVADAHERPSFTTTGQTPGAVHYVYPNDEASQRRAFGATTCNICGWCRYAHGGPVIPHTHACGLLTPTCNLLPPHLAQQHAPSGLHYNTPCLLANRLTGTELMFCSRWLASELVAAECERDELDARCTLLTELID